MTRNTRVHPEVNQAAHHQGHRNALISGGLDASSSLGVRARSAANRVSTLKRAFASMSLVFEDIDVSARTRPRWTAQAERVVGLGLGAGTSSSECFALAQHAPTARLQGFFVGLALARLPLENRHRSTSNSLSATRSSRARRRKGSTP